MTAAVLARILGRNPSYTAMRVGSPRLFQFTMAEARVHEWLCQSLAKIREAEALEAQALQALAPDKAA